MCLPDGSRMNREVHVRFCEGLWGRFPRSTLRSARRDLCGLELPMGGSFYPIKNVTKKPSENSQKQENMRE